MYVHMHPGLSAHVLGEETWASPQSLLPLSLLSSKQLLDYCGILNQGPQQYRSLFPEQDNLHLVQ